MEEGPHSDEGLTAARRTIESLEEQLEAARAARLSLRVQSRTDYLTSVGTRSFFLEQLDLALLPGSSQQAAVMMVDIDHFKAINDVHGHHAGDETLISVAARMRAVVSDRGIVSRFGGDEFAILLYSSDNISEIVRSLLDTCQQPVDAHGVTIAPQISIGAVVWDGEATEADMLRYADLAMYQARRTHQQAAIFDWTTKDELAIERAISDDLLGAIDRDLLWLAFQPIVSLTSGHPMSFEVLSRWSHPVFGNVSPAIFVGIAERNRLVSHLDRRILDRSAAWFNGGVSLPPAISLSINVSPLSLNRRFVEHVESVLDRNHIDPARLTFEVTETASVRDLKLVQATLNDLHDLGVRIALDDFGTGYSSLTYVHDLPISELKIDRSFVSRMLEDRKARELVRAIVQVGRALDLQIVAEGIETPEHAMLLERMGCTHGQGFYFSRPVNEQAVPSLSISSLPVAADQNQGSNLDGEQIPGTRI